jgi:hypothetical protein
MRSLTLHAPHALYTLPFTLMPLLLDPADQPRLCNVLSLVMRTSNTFIGSLLWVDFTRLLGMQKAAPTAEESTSTLEDEGPAAVSSAALARRKPGLASLLEIEPPVASAGKKGGQAAGAEGGALGAAELLRLEQEGVAK